MKCHWTVVEGERIFIPYCYASLYQEDGRYCTCRLVAEPRMASDEARREIKELTAENARLNRIIRNLLKRKQ